MSKSLSVLRAAASQVAEEEKEAGLDGMLKAADEIANERGLSSPLRRSQDFDASFRESSMHSSQGEGSSRGRGAKVSPRAPAAASAASAAAAAAAAVDAEEQDALALLKEMKIEPKISATVGFADDVQALLDHSKDQTPAMPSASASAALTASRERPESLTRQRYKKRIAQSTARSSTSSLGSERCSLVSEPAEVAVRLSLADDRSYAEHLKKVFRTEVEEMLFRSTFLIQKPGKGSRNEGEKLNYDTMRRSANRLAIPSARGPSAEAAKHDATLRFATFEDAQECTFRPHTKGKKANKRNGGAAGDDDNGAKEDPKFSFISRQEAEERNRREDLAFRIGQQDYDALVDKKICPLCGAKQSYDEVKEKRKKCPNCSVEYANPRTWGKVSAQFWKKCAAFTAHVGMKHEKLMKELDDELLYVTKKQLDANGQLVSVRIPRNKQVLTAEEEAAFFERMEIKMVKKAEKLRALEKEVYEEKCSFHPTVRRRRVDSDEEDDFSDDDKNVVQAFLQRYEEDMDYRREKMPQKYLEIRHHHRQQQHAEEKPFKV